MRKNIIFTGGGSGGHVIPCVKLIDSLLKLKEKKMYYIGSFSGIERSIIENKNISYFPIQTGKLRRSFSFKNFVDIFKVLFGIVQSFFYLRRFNKKETLLFSMGGFVSVPSVIAARVLSIPVYIHEQTTRVGLANKIASYFATKIFITFESSKKFFNSNKVVLSGYPLDDECYSKEIFRKEICSIPLEDIKKPVVFVTGGGNGSKVMNEFVKRNMEELKSKFFVFHQVGKNFGEEFKTYNDENYCAFEFLNEGIIDLFKKSFMVISRAGAGTVCELMALRKKSVFIPLKIAQRNEQFHNAKEASRLFSSLIISEDDFSLMSLDELEENFKTTGSILSLPEVNIDNNPKKIILEYINESI